MNVVFNFIFQLCSVLVIVGNQALSIVPEKWKPIVSGAIGIAMGAVSILAHFKNPDGTSSAKPYKPE